MPKIKGNDYLPPIATQVLIDMDPHPENKAFFYLFAGEEDGENSYG
jgi:hypothetical protein